MSLNPEIMRAVERLDYRVTVGDVAAQAGLDIHFAQQGLLVLASETGGNLQVAESGEIAYVFPRNFRAVLRNKYFRLRLKEWWDAIWQVLFYLIRISFGIILLASIVLIIITIIAIMAALNAANQNNDNRQDSGGGMVMMPNFWFSPNFFYLFYPDYSSRRMERRSRYTDDKPSMNFLESVFSFLFGDGNPNADLEERRWGAIATVIRNNRGAVAAEQISPYLDQAGSDYDRNDENYMLPVLTRFNGQPEVSPVGDIVYHFPELQTTAAEQGYRAVSAYLKEFPRRFSQASSGQILLAIGLGAVNLIGALMLGNLLAGGTVAVKLGGLVAFVQGIYWVLLGYGVAFLAVPLIRYFWVQWRNGAISARNEQRQERAVLLNQADEELQAKLAYAQQFAAETVIREDDLAYTTERDLTEQELEQADTIDAEWQRRLSQGNH